MESKETYIEGLKVRYFNGGSGDPLLIIHGGGSGAESWLAAASELTAGYCIYLPDLPGFGHSMSMGDVFDVHQYVDFIEKFSRAMGLKQFTVMGHSIGGSIALHYAVKYPGRLKALVLANSWSLGRETSLLVRFLANSLFCTVFGNTFVVMQEALDRILRLLKPSFSNKNRLSRVQVDIGRKMVNARGQTTLLLHRLKELKMPTLLLWGKLDAIVPPHHAITAAGLIPNSAVHIFEGYGHSVYMQNSREFADIVGRFLRSLVPG